MTRRAVAKIDDLGKLVLMGGGVVGEYHQSSPHQVAANAIEERCRKIIHALK